MLRSTIARIVNSCTRHRWPVIAVAVLVAVLSSVYAVRHFAIDTNINHLLSSKPLWRQHEMAYEKAFPQRAEQILVVVQARTPENAGQASEALAARIAQRSDVIRSIRQPGGGEFFDKNGLLYTSSDELARTTKQLTSAQPLLGTLAADPSLRGVMDGLSFGTMGVQGGQLKLDDLTRPLTMLGDTLDVVLAGHPASFSWRVLVKGKPADTKEVRRLIDVHPVLDFSALEPGKAATDAIRQAAADLKLASELGATVRLTGDIPLSDEEFATIREGTFTDILITVAAVLVILFLALRSWRIILAVFLALVVGFAATAALGLITVGALNPISVAFAVLFIGLGVDFGIQFSVRYRDERHQHDELLAALRTTGANVGAQLTLAAAAVTAAFFSFTPTDYRGLSELGIIAGSGMIIAFTTSITLLPALLSLLNPPPEPKPLGFAALAPVDRFMERHRIAIIVLTGLVALGGLPLLYFLRFDFNPLNLRNPNVESVATFLELKRDPDTGINAIQILAPSLSDADAVAKRVAKLPEVSRTTTLSDFVPEQQDEKLALIRKASAELGPTINPQRTKPAPSDAENVRALNTAADGLKQAANEEKGPGASAARRLSLLLSQLAKADAAVRGRTEAALIPSLKTAAPASKSRPRATPTTTRPCANSPPRCSPSSRPPRARRSRFRNPDTPSFAPSSKPDSGRSRRSRSCCGSRCGGSATCS